MSGSLQKQADKSKKPRGMSNRQITEPTSHEIVMEKFDVATGKVIPHRGKRRGKLSESSAVSAKKLRIIGACVRCKMLRDKVSFKLFDCRSKLTGSSAVKIILAYDVKNELDLINPTTWLKTYLANHSGIANRQKQLSGLKTPNTRESNCDKAESTF